MHVIWATFYHVMEFCNTTETFCLTHMIIDRKKFRRIFIEATQYYIPSRHLNIWTSRTYAFS